VYEGNIYSDGANTVCPSCKAVLVERSWHSVMKNRLTGDGRCSKCGWAVAGRWVNPRGQTAAKIAARAQGVADAKYSDLNL
jgi:pyruvate formate lyase activating enzyme